VCCDRSAAFIKEVEEQFPRAEITFDKSHVMKLVSEAVDDNWNEEQNKRQS